MLDRVTADTFLPRVGESFRFVVEGVGELPVVLAEVSPWGVRTEGPGTGRRFSLVFYGPRHSYLPQRIYRVESEHLDPLEIFLVPIGPDERGMRYEAVFS